MNSIPWIALVLPMIVASEVQKNVKTNHQQPIIDAHIQHTPSSSRSVSMGFLDELFRELTTNPWLQRLLYDVASGEPHRTVFDSIMYRGMNVRAIIVHGLMGSGTGNATDQMLIEHFEILNQMKNPSVLKSYYLLGWDKSETVKDVSDRVVALRTKGLDVVGMKVHSIAQQISFKSAHIQNAFEIANATNLSLLLHTGFGIAENVNGCLNVTYKDPFYLKDLIQQYPEVNVILAHLGKLWYESAQQLVRDNENVWVDASAFEWPMNGREYVCDPEMTLIPGDQRASIMNDFRHDRIVYGSGGRQSPGHEWRYLKMLNSEMPIATHPKFYYENAREAFQLDRRTADGLPKRRSRPSRRSALR